MNRLWAKIKALRGDTRGNVTIIFAFALLPLIGFVGASIDYSRAAALRTALQSALDATALMASKTAATQPGADLTNAAQQFFNAVFVQPNAQTDPVTVNYNYNNGVPTLTVTGSSKISTDFMKIVGYDNLSVGSSSTVTWGNTKLQVALVLDNSGSMSSSGKITALKTATHQLLTTLKGAATNDGDVQVSLVPFSKDVNVGSTNYGATWLRWTEWESEPDAAKTWIASHASAWSQTGPGSNCPFSWGSQGFGCASAPTTTSTTSSVPSSGTYSGYICPSVDYGNINALKIGLKYNGCYNSVPTTTTTVNTIGTGGSASCGTLSNCTCTGNGNTKVCKQTVTTTGAPYTHAWIKNDHSTWNGCVMDRDQDNDVQNTAPVIGTASTMFVPEQSTYCPPGTVLPLGYNWLALSNAVDAMQPNGSTNQTLGLALGWQTLTNSDPFNAPALKPDTSQVIILLSDGLNTQDRWYGNGSATSTQVDDRMTIACSKAKAAKIEIYTIQVNTGGDPKSAVLPACATDSDHFTMVTTSNQIISTFNTIATKLAQLRISR